MTANVVQNELEVLEQHMTALTDRIALEFRSVDSEIGDLGQLSTTAKSNLVAAVNEIKITSATPSTIDGGNF